MRLSTLQKQIIIQATRRNFGENVKIWLFGSRVDDERRGGDVDLYVETCEIPSMQSVLLCKINIEESLDLHVDLLVNDQIQNKPIYQIAKKTGIRL